jgi:hypothetical protein
MRAKADGVETLFKVSHIGRSVCMNNDYGDGVGLSITIVQKGRKGGSLVMLQVVLEQYRTLPNT